MTTLRFKLGKDECAIINDARIGTEFETGILQGHPKEVDFLNEHLAQHLAYMPDAKIIAVTHELEDQGTSKIQITNTFVTLEL